MDNVRFLIDTVRVFENFEEYFTFFLAYALCVTSKTLKSQVCYSRWIYLIVHGFKRLFKKKTAIQTRVCIHIIEIS